MDTDPTDADGDTDEGGDGNADEGGDGNADGTGSDDPGFAPAVRSVPELGPAERRRVFERSAGVEGVREDVRSILDRVREEGDVALREFTREFDGVEPGSIDVTDEAERAHGRLDGEVREAIEAAVANVRAFHEAQLPGDWRREFDGRELGRRFRPVDSAGVYVPGGRAAYPSSAVMGVVPAVVAGVNRVAVATPPAEEMPDATLAAAHAAGADAVYAVGGAQAVGALAYGTETVERVRTVVGPGNKYVTAAKAEVRGRGVATIDFLAGPSELLVVADGAADPAFVAADLLAQAEHDPEAAVAAVTDDPEFAAAVVAELEAQFPDRERRSVIAAAFENAASGVFHARSMSEAIAFADTYAPEHLSVQTADDEAVLDRITDVGSAFLGPHTPVAAGDYATGTNHVLPTGGDARSVGGLSVDTFLRASTVQRLDRPALTALADTVTTLAETEGLEAHAASVRARFGDDPDPPSAGSDGGSGAGDEADRSDERTDADRGNGDPGDDDGGVEAGSVDGSDAGDADRDGTDDRPDR